MLKVTYFSSFAIGESQALFSNIDEVNKDYELHSKYNPYYTILCVEDTDTGFILFEQSNPFENQHEEVEVTIINSDIKRFAIGVIG